MISKIKAKRKQGPITVQEECYRIPFIITYSKRTMKIKKVLRDRQELVDTCFVYTKVRPRITFRRKKNIKDMYIQKSLRGPPISNSIQEVHSFKPYVDKVHYRILCPCKGKHEYKNEDMEDSFL